MIAKGATIMLAVLVVGSGLLVGTAQPAEAKMSDTAKVIAGFAAGFVLADVLKDDDRRRCQPPRRDYRRPPAHVVRVGPKPPYTWRPTHGKRQAVRHSYQKGYRHGHADGYREGYGDGYRDGWRDRDRSRHPDWCF
jgi:hypothetical protein